MYLEISPRQTGKTTRLINQIYADKEKYDLQILMGMNFNSLKQIKQHIKRNNKLKVCLSFNAFEKEIAGKKNIRLYVDEFLHSTSFCNNFENFKKYISIIENGYYSSSTNTNMKILQIYFDLKQMNNNLVSSMHTTSNPFI